MSGNLSALGFESYVTHGGEHTLTKEEHDALVESLGHPLTQDPMHLHRRAVGPVADESVGSLASAAQS